MIVSIFDHYFQKALLTVGKATVIVADALTQV